MWKPALFLITVVLVTPAGRGALGQYAGQASALFAANSTYGDLAILATALVFLGLLLLLFCRSSKDPDTRWILRRVQWQEPSGAPANRTHRSL
jgi:preprotein translocase subunit SecG